MVITVKFIICFLLVLTVWLPAPKIIWAVPASYQAIQEIKEAEQQEPPVIIIEVPQLEYTTGNLRDPFEPEPFEEEEEEALMNQTTSQSKLPFLSIQGIVWGSGLPQAIINNQVVKIGDLIKGVRVVDISKEGVTVFYEGRQQLIAAPAVDMLQSQSPEPQRRTK